MKPIALAVATVTALTIFAGAASAMSSVPVDKGTQQRLGLSSSASPYGSQIQGGNGVNGSNNGYGYGNGYAYGGPAASGPDSSREFLNVDPFDPYAISNPYRYQQPYGYSVVPAPGPAVDPTGGRYSPQNPNGAPK